jgi:hypothetical protein
VAVYAMVAAAGAVWAAYNPPAGTGS